MGILAFQRIEGPVDLFNPTSFKDLALPEFQLKADLLIPIGLFNGQHV